MSRVDEKKKINSIGKLFEPEPEKNCARVSKYAQNCVIAIEEKKYSSCKKTNTDTPPTFFISALLLDANKESVSFDIKPSILSYEQPWSVEILILFG